ncbi:glycoside hydrolase family 9 protein [Niveibacterium sp. SC-1]|uniref:glycoside hydrolase family 9 protein n=1 Tax=Niveibacterium sp. SC-1 TaxID=3135646 RepID=UPI00311DAE57
MRQPDFATGIDTTNWAGTGVAGTQYFVTQRAAPTIDGGFAPMANFACLRLAPSSSLSEIFLSQGGIPALAKNTEYRLSFETMDLDTPPTYPGLNTLLATVRDDVTGDYYVQQSVLLNGLYRRAFAVSFKTPVNDAVGGATGATFAHQTRVSFALAKFGLLTEAAPCITNVSLTKVQAPAANAPAVRVNQFTYLMNGNKRAVLVNVPAGSTWELRHATAPSPFASGVASAGTLDPDSGDMVSTIDFSSVAADGTGYFADALTPLMSIVVRNSAGTVIATSPSFNIYIGQEERVGYSGLANTALNYFYQSRSGVPIKALRTPTLGDSLSRDAGHASDVAQCYSGTDRHGNNWAGSVTVKYGPMYLLKKPIYGGCFTQGGKELYSPFSLNVSGGWYDAADHGKYVTNAAVSVWALLNTYERMTRLLDPASLAAQPQFADGSQRYPEQAATQYKNGVSELLDEARYEMEFLLRMQAPANTVAFVPVGAQAVQALAANIPSLAYGVWDENWKGSALPTATTATETSIERLKMKVQNSLVDVSGMAFQSVHDDSWTGIPLAPAQDTKTRVLMYPTTAATLDLAAVAAQCARVWKTLDPAFSARCLNTATAAYAAAQRNPAILSYEYSNDWDRYPNPWSFGSLTSMFSGGGIYGDLRLKDERYWAAMELYLATGNASYKTAALAASTDLADAASGIYSVLKDKNYFVRGYEWEDGPNWQSVGTYGTLSALTVNPGGEFTTGSGAQARSNVLAAADAFLAERDSQGYLQPKSRFSTADRKNSAYRWGSNGDVLSHAMILGAAFDLTGNMKYANGVVDAMDYLLGRNALGVSYITGYGTKTARYPHHRFWAKAADIRFPQAPAGILVGGPSQQVKPFWQTADRRSGGIYDYDDASTGFFLSNTINACKQAPNTPAAVTFSAGDGTIKTVVPPFGEVWPQKCYSDDYRDFATNEVAINWNASLVWVAEFMAESTWRWPYAPR